MKSHVLVLPQPGVAPILVRIVEMGDRYGLDFRLMHDKPDPLIEFYDMRYPHTIFGQFVSRYNLDQMISHQGGLCLYGGENDWVVLASSMIKVKSWINDLIANEELM